MDPDMKKEEWEADQITKSQFFHQKLHEWELLEIAYELEKIKGENLNWRKDLSITTRAWDKVIHKGVRPVRVFAHPEVLKQNPKRVGYYRMLAMVSRKSMGNVGLPIDKYENGKSGLDNDMSLEISKCLNRIISVLIEHDESMDPREFDLWRGMGAGSTAQGSWGNVKGNRTEVVIKEMVERRAREKGLVLEEISHGKSKSLELSNGKILKLGTEPDIGVYESDGLIQMAIEIKGGIDTAAVLERFGATWKSLIRAKEENHSCVTILMMQGVSLTPTAKKAIENHKNVINHFFKIEDLIGNDDVREHFFAIMGI